MDNLQLKQKCIKDDCNYAKNGKCIYWTDDDGNIEIKDFPIWCGSIELQQEIEVTLENDGDYQFVCTCCGYVNNQRDIGDKAEIVVCSKCESELSINDDSIEDIWG